MSVPSLQIDSANNGLTRLIREAWRFPILLKEDEIKLAKDWQDRGDAKAAHALVTSHLRLVVKIALGYRGYGLPVADLISEGNIGLMRAVKKFKPELGFRLSTYAMWWIKASITEYVLRSWSLVKIGTVVSQKKLFFNLRKIKAKLNIQDNLDLSDSQAAFIAKETKTSKKEVVQMNRRLFGRDMSLNAPLSDQEPSANFQDKLVDPQMNPEDTVAKGQESEYRRKVLHKALEILPSREKSIFVERFLKEDPKTLAELGKIHNVSRERIRQLETRAFEKIGKAVKKEMRKNVIAY